MRLSLIDHRSRCRIRSGWKPERRRDFRAPDVGCSRVVCRCDRIGCYELSLPRAAGSGAVLFDGANGRWESELMGSRGAIAVGLVLITAACSSSGATTSKESIDPTIVETSVPGDDDAPASNTATAAGVLDGIWWKPRVPDERKDLPITYQFGSGDLFVLDGRAQLTAPVFRVAAPSPTMW